jgi:hypothetical protein
METTIIQPIEKMIKRFDRLRNYILNTSNKINFLFVNRLITDNNNLNDNILKFSINNQKSNYLFSALNAPCLSL